VQQQLQKLREGPYLTEALNRSRQRHLDEVHRFGEQLAKLPGGPVDPRSNHYWELLETLRGLVQQQDLLDQVPGDLSNPPGQPLVETFRQLALVQASDQWLVTFMGRLGSAGGLLVPNAGLGPVGEAEEGVASGGEALLAELNRRRSERRNQLRADLLRERAANPFRFVPSGQPPLGPNHRLTLEVVEDDLPPAFRGTPEGKLIPGRCQRTRFRNP
jgi:hypothetical protein